MRTDRTASGSSECSSLPGSPRPSKGNNKTTKTVVFDESQNKYHKSAANARHKRTCWYDVQDYLQFKASVATTVKQITQNQSEANCSYQRVMYTVFHTCCNAEISEMDLSSTTRTVSVLSPKDRQDLERSISNSNSRLGLEHLIVDALCEDRFRRRKVLLRRLLEVQREAASLPCQFRPVLIHRNMEPITRPNRLFALEKAQALSKFDKQ